MFKVPERYRKQSVAFPSTEVGDLHGMFIVPASGLSKAKIRCIASSGWADAVPWEHVSVQPIPPVRRCPTWEEMCFVKDLFWDEEDCVVQYHPPRSEHVNMAPFCLHLWRPTKDEMPRPPSIAVGVR
jgi:hypothetical protein